MSKLSFTLCIFALLTTMLSVQAQPKEAKTGTATISGRVTLNGEPVANVAVALQNPVGPSRSPGIRVKTDGAGQFRFTGVAAGRYALGAHAPGFISPIDRPQDKLITVSEGENMDGGSIELKRGGAIAGRVTDSRRRAIAEEKVVLMKLDEQGRPQHFYNPMNEYFSITDDRGFYRLFGLPAGRYLVSVGQKTQEVSRLGGRRIFYPQTFHPEATEESKAEVIELSEGGEAAGVDIAVAETKRTYIVSGRIVDAETGQPVTMIDIGYVKMTEDGARGGGESRVSRSDANGRFQISLPPGKCSLFGGESNGDYFIAPTPIEVGDKDVSGVEIKARRGATISGVVTMEGSYDRAVLARLPSLTLLAHGRSDFGYAIRRSGKINPDGGFRISGLQPGKVALSFSGRFGANKFSILRVERGGVPQEHQIEIGAGEQANDLRFVLGYGVAAIRGQSTIIGGAAPPEIVVRAYAKRIGGDQNSNIGSQVDASGQFVIKGLTAGEITGRVVADDGGGLANVMVSISVVGARSGGPRTTATDENGEFRFSDLDQQEYAISLGNFGGYVWRPPTEAERQRLRYYPYYRIGDDVTAPMTRGGVITGRVTNANGEPVIAVAVTAVEVRDAGGAPLRDRFPSRPRFTDDRGVYRIYGLKPGTYVLVANRRDINFRPSPPPYDDELPAYHPAAATRAEAAEIKVSAGAEVTGVDIRYSGASGHAIRGVVSGGKGIDARPAVSVELFNVQGESSTDSIHVGSSDDDRSFAFYGLQDGEYIVTARGKGDDQSLSAALARITLSGADVAGIELKLDPLGSVSGRIVIEGLPNSCDAKRKISLERFSIALMRDDLLAEALPFRYSNVSTGENGRFTINAVVPGHYRVMARSPDGYLYVKAIAAYAATPARRGAARAAGSGGVSQNGFTFRPGEKMTGVIVTFAEGAASLRGKVVPENEDARLPSRFRLHLIPADPKATDDVLRYAETIVRSEGAFAFNNIAPGKYWLLTRAVPDDEPIDRPPFPAAWDANERAKLRREAETLKAEVELRPCQRIADQVVKYLNQYRKR